MATRFFNWTLPQRTSSTSIPRPSMALIRLGRSHSETCRPGWGHPFSTFRRIRIYPSHHLIRITLLPAEQFTLALTCLGLWTLALRGKMEQELVMDSKPNFMVAQRAF